MGVFSPAMHGDLRQAMPHKTRKHHPWLMALGIIILGVVALGVLGSIEQPGPVNCTPPSCVVPPPHRQPLTGPHHFVSSTYGFSLDYSTANIDPSKVTDSSIAWDGTLGDSGEVFWEFAGVHPHGRSEQQIVDDIQNSNFPDATLAYTIPGADIGYTPGYGNVYDLSEAPGGGAAVHERLIVIAAIKRGVGVVMAAVGPYQQTNPHDDGHPNPADTPLVNLGDFEENLKSVTWKGDPPL
jgi:hypothetical protein